MVRRVGHELGRALLLSDAVSPDAMAQALATVQVKPPSVPLVANVLARPIKDPAELGPAIKEAVAVVKSGQPALVNVWTQPR